MNYKGLPQESKMRRPVAVNHPTDRKSIVANLVWGILMICLVGSPSGASGQDDQPVLDQDIQDLAQALGGVWTEPVPAQDIEKFDVWTRLTWTIRMVVAPGTLAHVRPLYAYNPAKLGDRTVYSDRIGHVATVKRCPNNYSSDVPWCAYYRSNTLDSKLLSFDVYGDGELSSDIYFATTYPLPDTEPDKRFVVEQPE